MIGPTPGGGQDTGRDLKDEFAQAALVVLGPVSQLDDLTRQAGGLGRCGRDVDRFALAGGPGGDLPQLGQGQGPAGIEAEVLGPHQRGERVDGSGGLASDRRARCDQDSQRIAGTVCTGDAQRVDRRAEHRAGDPGRVELVALAPELGALLRASITAKA